jgi:hypothetical protein
VIDEAIVDGKAKDTKTVASAGMMYLTPDLELEVRHYADTLAEDPAGWLFQSTRKGVPAGKLPQPRVETAAVRAGLSVFKTAKGKLTSGVNFQSLRRTSSTLFGARAKDPKSTQADMRHTDPYVTLKHYQREIPAEVRAAALALERDLPGPEAQSGRNASERRKPSACLRFWVRFGWATARCSTVSYWNSRATRRA